jgi:hypothetical protein
MRRIILLLAVVITSTGFAQEKAAEPAKKEARVLEQKFTVSLVLRVSEPDFFAVTLETKKEKLSFGGFNKSNILTAALGSVTVSTGLKDVIGSGFVVEMGSRIYYKKGSWSGFYTQSGIEGGTIKFSDTNYTGKYSYFSFFNPDLGFKWQVSKGFSIDPSIGCMWKIEWKGSGDVDNKIFTNFVPKIGLKIGYSF